MNKLLATLRDRKTKSAQFRVAAEGLCVMLGRKVAVLLEKQEVMPKHVVPVVILRSGLVFLGGIVRLFPSSAVGVLGMKRNDKTFEPDWYYENLPALSKTSVVIIFDPMLATGGSAEAAILCLRKKGVLLRNIYFVGIIAAPEGLSRLSQYIPKNNIVLAAIDQKLDANKMIVPGLGDFGDRYFGTL